MPFSKQNRPHTLNGILFIALFALSSLYIAQMPWLIKAGISPLVIAIVLRIFMAILCGMRYRRCGRQVFILLPGVYCDWRLFCMAFGLVFSRLPR